MAGFEDIGALLGLPASNELSYQKGLALGANTQNAMQQARERVRQNTAIEQLTSNPSVAAELGINPALLTAVAGGIDPRQITGAAKDTQERNFRATAGSDDPSVDAGARNRALYGIASGPVKPFEAVGTHGYQDILHPESGIMPIPGAATGGGGDAAAIQVLRAFGFLDAGGHVAPGREKDAFDVMRTTGKTVDEGGVPGVIDFNPFAHSAPAHNVPAAAGGAPDMSGLIPPVAAPVVPASTTPAPPVAGAGVAQPVSSAGRVASNVAEIEKAKAIGKGAGDASVALPDAVADIEKLRGSVQGLLAAPGFNGVYGNVQGQPLARGAMGLLSQDVADAQGKLKNIDAQTFGIAIQKMRGLGQLSNAEGLKVTDAFTRASNPLISEPEAREAWAEVLTYLDAAEARVNRKTQLPGGAPPAAPAVGGAYADPAKEARYQAWKAAHGGQ